MEKMVSVIIPVYQVEQYLDRCLECVTRQTYPNLEILLVDDGSRDASPGICDAWKERDPRILVIHQKNGGLSNARNTGIRAATGDYLTFVDSDDALAPDMVERLVALLETHQADISICGVNHIFDENNIHFESCGAPTTVYDPSQAIQAMWYQTAFLPSAWGKVYKRYLFDTLRFTEGRLFEDIDLMHELFWASRKIVWQNEPLYGYVHRENSITTAKFSLRDCDILIISNKMLEFAQKHDPNLMPAAQAYAVAAAFRIFLNAPQDKAEFTPLRAKAEALLKQYGKSVLRDKNARKKTKYALLLYFYCRPLLQIVYKRKNRWK